MDTPTLPDGYFFRVNPGTSEEFWNQEDCLVEIRYRRFFGFSTQIIYVRIPETSFQEPTKEQLSIAMRGLILTWEERKAHVSPYGDYPPKKLKDLK